jgi:hypothetical protein
LLGSVLLLALPFLRIDAAPDGLGLARWHFSCLRSSRSSFAITFLVSAFHASIKTTRPVAAVSLELLFKLDIRRARDPPPSARPQVDVKIISGSGSVLTVVPLLDRTDEMPPTCWPKVASVAAVLRYGRRA